MKLELADKYEKLKMERDYLRYDNDLLNKRVKTLEKKNAKLKLELDLLKPCNGFATSLSDLCKEIIESELKRIKGD